jgi:hypothetical protein
MRKTMLAFIGIFLFMIYAVPISQAIKEKSQGKRIQVLDLCTDACAVPVGRAKTANRLLVAIQHRLDSIAADISGVKPDSSAAWDAQKTLARVDEIMVDAAELGTTVATINRHVKLNPESRESKQVSAYVSSFPELNAAALSGDINATRKHVESAIAATKELMPSYPSPSLFGKVKLMTKNVPNMFWDAKYLRPFEKEMENSSMYTANMRPVMFFFKYALFGDLGEKGVTGRNGWFYYRSDVDYVVRPYVLDKRSLVVDPNDKVVTDNPVIAIKKFKNQLSDMGIDLIVVLMPAKPSIYPDMLNASIKPEMSGKIGTTPRMIEELRAQGVDAIDLFTAFAQERRNDAAAGDSLYLSKDTHWRARGVRTAAHVIAERIKQMPWYQEGGTEYVLDSVDIERVGDIGVMTALPAFRVHHLSLSFPTEKTRCYQVYQVFRDASGNETGRVLYKDDFRNSTVLLLGDSYSRIYQTDEPRSAGWISHIACELKQPIASLVNDGGASMLVRQSLCRRVNLLNGKKCVIWEIVERDLRYGEDGWKDTPLITRIAKILKKPT